MVNNWDRYELVEEDPVPEEVQTFGIPGQKKYSPTSQEQEIPYQGIPGRQAPGIQESKDLTENKWNRYELVEEPESQEDSIAQTIGRYLYQPITGALNVTIPGMIGGAWDLLATGEALSEMEDFDDYRISELKKKFPSAPWE